MPWDRDEMARTFGLSCTKAFLVIYNFVFLISGGVMLAAGIWLRFDTDLVSFLKIMDSTPTVSGPHLETLAHILMGIGAFVVIISFLGCCGTCCESMCLLVFYSALLFMVLATEMTCGILAAVFKKKIGGYIQHSMLEQVRTHYNRTVNTTDFLTKAWDRMQIDLECCGSRGPTDFQYSYWFNHSKDEGTFVPATCCYLSNDNPDYPMIINENQCQIDAILFPDEITESEAIKARGCYRALLDWFKKHHSIIVTIGVILFSLQILALVLSCCLMRAIKREQSKYPWYIDDDEE